MLRRRVGTAWWLAAVGSPFDLVVLAAVLLRLVGPLALMHLRGTELTRTDTMHIVLAIVTVLLMLLAIGFGAAAFGKRFCLYSIATVVSLVAFGALTGLDGPRIAANLLTPWVGVWERINIGVFLLWVAVLAIALLRAPDTAGRVIRDEPGRPPLERDPLGIARRAEG